MVHFNNLINRLFVVRTNLKDWIHLQIILQLQLHINVLHLQLCICISKQHIVGQHCYRCIKSTISHNVKIYFSKRFAILWSTWVTSPTSRITWFPGFDYGLNISDFRGKSAVASKDIKKHVCKYCIKFHLTIEDNIDWLFILN